MLRSPRRSRAATVFLAGLAGACAAAGLTGCAGGSPLLHPAQTLASGDVRAAGGLSAQVVVGSLANDLSSARAQAARDPDLPGPPGTNPGYARGALVAAALAPGLAPFVGARVGIGGQAEGGIAYTGRGVRIDMRRAFTLGTGTALSIGGGVSAPFYGRQQGEPLPNVDLSSLRGYGADVPVLVGWESSAGIYRAWAGVRGGFEYDSIENLTSEPKPVTLGVPPIGLSATRYYGSALVGLAAGFRYLHVALELDATYQTAHGRYNGTTVDVQGVALTPATAVWWQF